MSNQQEKSADLYTNLTTLNDTSKTATTQMEEERKDLQAEAYKNNDQRPLPTAYQQVPRQEVHALANAQASRDQADNQKASE